MLPLRRPAICRHNSGTVKPIEHDADTTTFPLAPEAPVSLFVDDKRLAVLMCSPFELDELAIGHLFSRGIIGSREDLSALFICPDARSVKIRTVSGIGGSLEFEGYIVSACGAARVDTQAPAAPIGVAPVARANAALADAATGEAAPVETFTLDVLSQWARAMFAAADLYRKTGGLHVAALACPSAPALAWSAAPAPALLDAPEALPSYFVVREDVGRHNAVDKVLGRGLLDRVDFSRSVILTSGRIAADMIQKAARSGVPVLVSRSIPTTEAYSIALDAGITLVGRIGSANPIVYTRADRVRRAANDFR